MIKAISVAMILSTAVSAVTIVDGEYPILRPSSSQLNPNLCRSECTQIYQAGQFMSKVVTYDQEIASTVGGIASTVSCGDVFTFQINYNSNTTLSLNPISCTQLDNNPQCNHDLCNAWTLTSGYWSAQAPLPFSNYFDNSGFFFTLGGDNYDFAMGTCAATCGALSFTAPITPIVATPMVNAISGGSTCGTSKSLNFPMFCTSAELQVTVPSPSAPVTPIAAAKNQSPTSGANTASPSFFFGLVIVFIIALAM